MAKLPTFLGSSAKTGKDGTIKAPIPVIGGWTSIGNGKWDDVSDYDVVFDGKVDFEVTSSKVDLKVNLTDKNSSATSGPTHITINGSSYDGTYKVDGDELVVNFKSKGDNVKLKLYRVDSGKSTGIKIDGTDDYNGTLHITS